MLISEYFLDDLFVFTHFLKGFWAYLFIALEGNKGIGRLIEDLDHNFLATEVMEFNGFSDHSSLTLVKCNFSPLCWHF